LVAVLILLFLLGLPPASDALTVLVMGVPALAASLLLELLLAAVAVFLPRAASLPVPIMADSASLAAGGLVSVLMLLGLPPASDGSTVLMIGVPALAAPLLLAVLLVAVAVFLPRAAFLPVPLMADLASWAAGGLVAVLIPWNLLGLPPAADGLMELTMVAPALAASLAVFPFLVARGVVLPVAVLLASLLVATAALRFRGVPFVMMALLYLLGFGGVWREVVAHAVLVVQGNSIRTRGGG
jgi:hypothetical protein